MKNKNLLKRYQFYKNQKEMLDASALHDNPFYFKHGNTKFAFAPDFDDFFDAYKYNLGLSIYELIPFQGKLPLYLDIEYYDDKVNDEPLEAFLELYTKFVTVKLPSYYNGQVFDWKISKATREKVIGDSTYMYHSFHVVLNSSKLYFKNQSDIKTLLKNMEYWAQNSQDETILNLYTALNIESPRNKEKGIIDYKVYNVNIGTFKAFRLPFSQKSNGNDILVPCDSDDDDLKEYFVSYNKRYGSSSYSINIPPSWVQSSKLVANSVAYKIPNPSLVIPTSTTRRICDLFNRYHPNGKFVSSRISPKSGDFIFKFCDYQGKCLYHNRVHTDMTNNNYFIIYKPDSFKYMYCCHSLSNHESKIYLNPVKNIKSLINWNYEYSGRKDIKCDPLISTDVLPIGGTFLLEAPKGTGKTEAITKLLDSEIEKNPNCKILNLTYRVSLATKYQEELKDYGFHHYSDRISKQSDVDRIIVLIDSLHKLVSHESFKQIEYDIIIIDEIYSILEGWTSSLMGHRKLHLMSIFETILKKAKYVYLLDAHLNNKLVINTISKLRASDKFIAHKNPQCHYYGDYYVNWYEPIVRKDKPLKLQLDKLKWLDQLMEKLRLGKKIGFVSATKQMAIELSSLVDSNIKSGMLPASFSHLIYTSETPPALKKISLSDVELYWKNLDLVIYSPTISAGTSYNVSDKFGFDELYVYLKSKGGASFNTLNQMLFRIRQLNDKQYHIFYDKEINSQYRIDEENLESQMLTNSEIIFEAFGKPMCEKPFELDAKFKPIFNTEHWSYTMWLETVYNSCHYSKSHNFKKGIINELCNSPADLSYAGRGMKLIDHSIELVNLEVNEVSKIGSDLEASKETKLIDDFNEFIDLDPINQLNITKINNGQILDDIVHKQYYKYKLAKDLRLDYQLLEELPTEEMKLDIYKKIRSIKNIETLFRQRDFFNNDIDIQKKGYQIHSKFYSYAEKQFNGKKDLKYIQILEQQWNQSYHTLVGIKDILKLLNIHDYSHLDNVLVDRSVFEDILIDKIKRYSLFNLIKIYFNKILPEFARDTTKFKHIQNRVKVWYENNPGKHLYDEISLEKRDAFLKANRIQGGVQSFKTNCWKKKRSCKAKNQFDEMCLSGRWTCSDWKAVTPDCWSITHIKNYIEKVLQFVLGFEFELIIDNQKKWTSVKLRNSFEWLSHIQTKGLDFI